MLLRPLVQREISEIEKYIAEIKTADVEGDSDRLEINVRLLDRSTYKLLLEIHSLNRLRSKE
jgi:hypothetical protein